MNCHLRFLLLTWFSLWACPLLSQSLSLSVPMDQVCDDNVVTMSVATSGLGPAPVQYTLEAEGFTSPQPLTGVLSPLGNVFFFAPQSSGNFTIEMTVTDGDETLVEEVDVTVNPSVVAQLGLANVTDDFSVTSAAGETTFAFCGGLVEAQFQFDFGLAPSNVPVDTITVFWGDGTATGLSPGQPFPNHVYAPGEHTLTVVVLTEAGCTSQVNYTIFVGTAPEFSVTSAGDELCLPGSHDLSISSNGAFIDFDIFYSDNFLNINSFSTSNDTTVIHEFESSSCGSEVEIAPGFKLDNAYQATIVGSNVCSTNNLPTIFSVSPIVVSEGPELDIESSVGQTVCPGTTFDVVNNSEPPQIATLQGCSENYPFYWKLDPGLTLISGSLGSNENLIGDNLDSDGWIVGSETIELEAVEFGTHRVWLFADSPCGPDSTEFPIHVLEPGVLSMQPATQEICPGDSTLAVDFEVTPSSYPITWMVLQENMLPVLPGNDYGMENLLGAGVGEASTPSWNPVHEEDEEVVLFVEARVPCPVSEPALHQITIHPATAFEPLADFSVCPGFAAELELETNTGDLVFWTSESTDNVQGASSHQFGTSVDDVLNNDTTLQGVTTYTFTTPNAECPSLPMVVDVTVEASVPLLAKTDVALCPGETVPGAAFPPIQNGTWSWTNSNDNVGLDDAGVGNISPWNTSNESTEYEQAEVEIFGQVDGCPLVLAASFNVTVFPFPAVDIDVQPDGNLSCVSGQAEASFLPAFQGELSETQVSGGVLVNQDLGSAVVAAAGSYFVNLTSLEGCTSVGLFDVGPQDDIQIESVTALDPLCHNEASGAIELTTDEDGPVLFEWTPAVSDDAVAEDLEFGDYQIVVTNAALCRDSVQVELGNPSPIDIVLVDSVVSECGEANGLLHALATGGTGSLSYKWDNGDRAPVASDLDEGIHTLTVEDDNGCQATLESYLPCLDLIPPIPCQFISPNGDGQNDEWRIENIEFYPEATVQVFDRWGLEVYQATPPYLNTWQGTWNGQPLPAATYFYVVDTKKKSQKPFRGYLELQTVRQ